MSEETKTLIPENLVIILIARITNSVNWLRVSEKGSNTRTRLCLPFILYGNICMGKRFE